MNRGLNAGPTAHQSARFESFTEAVPLSLSSMAHASLPLQDGVLDGVRQVLSHTLLSCVNYARIVHPPHQWTFRDLTTSEFAWTPVKGEDNPSDLPFSLQRLKFRYQYSRNAWIYLKTALPKNLTAISELEQMADGNWTRQIGVLGRVSLLYVSKEPLTPGEMDGTEIDDMPPTILYRIIAEYRSLPPTGSQQAVQAEELSMLSFGGSVDDDVKYGALASLYDETAKYVLEIYSVRGKKYKFDLMDSTLNDGSVPRLPSSREGDPFVKCLCATVTDHTLSEQDAVDDSDTNSLINNSTDGKERRRYAITRMHLTLEGKPRSKNFENLPKFDYMANAIMASFLQLNPELPSNVSASPSGHTLLLDPSLAGQIFVNGRYVTQWGRDQRIGSSGVALFGMDLHSIPFWHGRIVDYEAMKEAYAQMWADMLVDARLAELNIAGRLLYRLMMGYDLDEDENDLYDDEDDLFADTDLDCLESQVLSSPEYDRVGVASKALGTRFGMEFGRAAFPCLEHEVEWVKRALPGRKPVAVPQRLLKILRRGGYHSIQQASDDMWFARTRPPKDGDEKATVVAAIELLVQAGCDDVLLDQIVFVNSSEVDDSVAQKAICRYNQMLELYCVQEKFMGSKTDELMRPVVNAGGGGGAEKLRAFLLGMYIAMEHPDGSILARYMLRHKA